MFLLVASLAAANQAAAEPFELPPPHSERPAALAVEPHVELTFPARNDNLCPGDAPCVFDSGAGLGVLVERRARSGFAIGGAYDVWLMDGAGFYELSTLQTITVSFRGYFAEQYFLHPFFGAAIGPALFGDSFRVDTFGLVADVVGGVEIEMTRALAMTGSFGVRALWTPAFSTPGGQERGDGVDVAVSVRVGLVLYVRPD